LLIIYLVLERSFLFTAESIAEIESALSVNYQVEPLQRGNLIGQGRFSIAYTSHFNNKSVAVKQLKIDRQDLSLPDGFFETVCVSEIESLLTMQHMENADNYKGGNVELEAWFIAGNSFNVVLELMDLGNLKDYLQFNDKLDLTTRLRFAKSVCRGIRALHTAGFVHLDVAARNVLLKRGDNQVVAKLADYGLSRKVGFPLKQTLVDYKRLPPEIVLKTASTYTVFADIWSFGLLCWEIWTYCKTEPFNTFNDSDFKQLLGMVSASDFGGSMGDTKYLSQWPDETQSDLITIIQKCLSIKPQSRLLTSWILISKIFR